MTMAFIRLIDTCLPDYLTDHCNGDHEALIAVPVDGTMTMRDLREGIIEAAAEQDKIPAGVTPNDIQAAAFMWVANSGRHVSDFFNADLPPAEEQEETCYAYFRMTWEETCYAYFRMTWEEPQATEPDVKEHVKGIISKLR